MKSAIIKLAAAALTFATLVPRERNPPVFRYRLW